MFCDPSTPPPPPHPPSRQPQEWELTNLQQLKPFHPCFKLVQANHQVWWRHSSQQCIGCIGLAAVDSSWLMYSLGPSHFSNEHTTYDSSLSGRPMLTKVHGLGSIHPAKVWPWYYKSKTEDCPGNTLVIRCGLHHWWHLAHQCMYMVLVTSNTAVSGLVSSLL